MGSKKKADPIRVAKPPEKKKKILVDVMFFNRMDHAVLMPLSVGSFAVYLDGEWMKKAKIKRRKGIGFPTVAKAKEFGQFVLDCAKMIEKYEKKKKREAGKDAKAKPERTINA